MIPSSFVLRSILIVLTPFAIYFLVIARINRRPTATVVSGIADCIGLVLAFSGLLFYLGPGILTGFHFWPRDIWLYNHYSLLHDSLRWWRIACVAYLVVLGGGVVVLLWKRRTDTVIYNVGAADVDHAVVEVLDRLGLSWTRSDTGMQIRRGAELLNLNIESSPVAAHVTLNWWVGKNPVRTFIEDSLTQVLHSRPVEDHRSGNRLMLMAAALFVTLFVIAALYRLVQFHENTGHWPWQ